MISRYARRQRGFLAVCQPGSGWDVLYLRLSIRYAKIAPATSRATARAATGVSLSRGVAAMASSVVRSLGSASPMMGSVGRPGFACSSSGCWTGVGWGSNCGGSAVGVDVGVGVGVDVGVGVNSLGSMTVTGAVMLESRMVGMGTRVGSSVGRAVGVGAGCGVAVGASC